MYSNHLKERLSVPRNLPSSRNILRTLITISSILNPRDIVAPFRSLFRPPGSGLDSPMSPPKPRKITRPLGVVSLGEFGTGAIDERRFFSRLAALVPASRRAEGLDSTGMKMRCGDKLDSSIDRDYNHLPPARTAAAALGVDP